MVLFYIFCFGSLLFKRRFFDLIPLNVSFAVTVYVSTRNPAPVGCNQRAKVRTGTMSRPSTCASDLVLNSIHSSPVSNVDFATAGSKYGSGRSGCASYRGCTDLAILCACFSTMAASSQPRATRSRWLRRAGVWYAATVSASHFFPCLGPKSRSSEM